MPGLKIARVHTTAMATRPLDLTEWHRSEPIALSVDERDALAGILPSITVQPEQGENAKYTLTPGSTVGAVDIGDFSVVIRPKIGIPQLLSLACYAIGQHQVSAGRTSVTSLRMSRFLMCWR